LSLVSFDVAYMYLYDSTNDRLIPLGGRGMWHPEALTPRGHNVIESTTSGGEPVVHRRYMPLSSHQTHVVDNLDDEKGFRTMKGEGVRSAIFVPLQAEDDILGILQLGSRTPRHFEPGDIRLMEAIGRQMGIAVQKIRAYEETRQAYAEQKSMEEARERLVAILETTTDVVGILRIDGRRMYLNRAGRRLLGLSDEDDIANIHVAEGRPDWAKKRLMNEAIPAAIRDGTWSGETAFLGPDGAEFPFSQVIIAHEDADGRVAFLSTIARDISPQKDAERQKEALAQTEKLRALGQMAGGIAHDLNQCLALVA